MIHTVDKQTHLGIIRMVGARARTRVPHSRRSSERSTHPLSAVEMAVAACGAAVAKDSRSWRQMNEQKEGDDPMCAISNEIMVKLEKNRACGAQQ